MYSFCCITSTLLAIHCVIVGEVIPSNTDATPDDKEKGDKEKEEKDDDDGTFYRLRGIVVHSGQASGGHYYSFISYRYKQYDNFTVCMQLFFYSIDHPIVQCPDGTSLMIMKW